MKAVATQPDPVF